MRPIPCLPPISFSSDSKDAGERCFPFTEMGSPETIPISTYLHRFGGDRNGNAVFECVNRKMEEIVKT